MTSTMEKVACATLIGLVILAQVPYLPLLVGALLNIILGSVSLAALYILYSYYRSLPTSKATLLTYLARLFVVCASVTVAWYLLVTVALAFPSLIEFGLRKSVKVTCSLMTYEITTVPMCACCIGISMVKIFVVIKPLQFPEIDHEYRFKQILAGFVIVVSTQLTTYFFVKDFSICGNRKLKFINEYVQQRIDPELNVEYIVTDYRLFSTNLLVFLTISMIYKLLKAFLGRYKQVDQKITKFEPLPLPPRVTYHNLRVLSGEFSRLNPETPIMYDNSEHLHIADRSEGPFSEQEGASLNEQDSKPESSQLFLRRYQVHHSTNKVSGDEISLSVEDLEGEDALTLRRLSPCPNVSNKYQILMKDDDQPNKNIDIPCKPKICERKEESISDDFQLPGSISANQDECARREKETGSVDSPKNSLGDEEELTEVIYEKPPTEGLKVKEQISPSESAIFSISSNVPYTIQDIESKLAERLRVQSTICERALKDFARGSNVAIEQSDTSSFAESVVMSTTQVGHSSTSGKDSGSKEMSVSWIAIAVVLVLISLLIGFLPDQYQLFKSLFRDSIFGFVMYVGPLIMLALKLDSKQFAVRKVKTFIQNYIKWSW